MKTLNLKMIVPKPLTGANLSFQMEIPINDMEGKIVGSAVFLKEKGHFKVTLQDDTVKVMLENVKRNRGFYGISIAGHTLEANQGYVGTFNVIAGTLKWIQP